jgi:asparagine synthetase B (glutamine-hydrolysing)
MLESLLTIKNFCWSADAFCPSIEVGRAAVFDRASAAALQGRFAFASPRPDGGVTLARDRLGLNKLFLAIHESGTVLAANYLIDLVRRGVPFESIYSVPAGHLLHLDPAQDVVALSRYADADSAASPQDAGLQEVARSIREQLDVWFARLAAQFGRRKICVCLSGGVDSGVIAALARQYFSDVTAYTYAFVEPGTSASEDAVYAERLAAALGIPFRLVPASSEDVLATIDDALCYGQDWRDFNVHCAIVNEIVARAIRRDVEADGSGVTPLVFTGDLANEFLADYATEQVEGREYYRLPAIDPVDLRLVLIRGLDAGDREVGIFGHHGLDVVQPYGLAVDRYLLVPGSLIRGERSKQKLAKAMADDLLPGYVFDRVKVRAQIGSSTRPTGILPLLARRGYDGVWLRSAFCRLFMIEHQAFLNRFIRAGRYRNVNRLTHSRVLTNGYIAA